MPCRSATTSRRSSPCPAWPGSCGPTAGGRWCGNAAFVATAALLEAGEYLYLVHLSDAAPYREAQIDSLGDVRGLRHGR